MAYLPEGPQPYGPTAQALPSWLSYQPVATDVRPYVTSATRIIYDPQGTEAPRETVVVQSGVTTDIQFSIKYVPLEYTGPFPAPDLGTLYTTPGQRPAPSASNSNPPSNEGNTSVRPTTSARPTTANSQPNQTGSVAPTVPASSAASAPTNGSSQQQSQAPAPTNSASVSGVPPPASSAAASSLSANDSAALGSLSSLASVMATASGAAASAAASSLSAAASSISADAASSLAGPSAATAASQASVSAESASRALTSASSPTTNSASTIPAPTAGTLPPAVPTATPRGLSAGQIAGIVVGSFFALLLLLLLLACLFRKLKRRNDDLPAGQAQHGRRISDRFASAWSGSGNAAGQHGGGSYAALAGGAGAGLGAAAAAAAAAEKDSDTGSDEWEEDQLSGGDGSGFFIVGGRRRDGAGSWRGSRPGGQAAAASPAAMSRPSSASANAVAAYDGVGRGSPTSVRGMRNIPSSRHSKASTGLLGGLLAGALFARHSSRNEKKGRPVPKEAEDDGSEGDDDLLAQYSNVAEPHDERRGLMGMGPFGDESEAPAGYASQGRNHEMQQAGPSRWGGWDGALAATGAGSSAAAYLAGSRMHPDDGDLGVDPMSSDDEYGLSDEVGGGRSSAATAGQRSGPRDSYGSSSLGVGSDRGLHSPELPSIGERGAVAAGAAGAAGGVLAARQGQGHDPFDERPPQYGASLPPPPRAPRRGSSGSPSVPATSKQTSGNGSSGSDERSSQSTAGPADRTNALLGVDAAAAGLGSWAAGHRESHGSTYSKGHYPSGGIPPAFGQGDGPAASYADADRHSKFISDGTNLLGPAATRTSPSESNESLPHAASSGSHGSGPASATQHTRLPTIQSVGEFGERAGEHSDDKAPGENPTVSSSGDGGSRGAKSFVTTSEGRVPRDVDPPAYQYRDVTSPTGTMGQPRPTSGWTEQPGSRATSRVSLRSGEDTGLDGNITGSEQGPRASIEPDAHSSAAAAGGAGGLLGGLTAGWKRLTMGITPGPAPSSRQGTPVSVSREGHEEARQGELAAIPRQASQPRLAAGVRSQQASVHEGPSVPSSLSQRHSSKEASEDSQRDAAALGDAHGPSKRASVRTAHTADSVLDSETHGAGYAASVSNTTSSGSSGSRNRSQRSALSSSSRSTHPSAASWRAQGGGSGSSRSGNSSRGGHPSEASNGGPSDAASYAPSDLHRQSTASTRGAVSSISGRAAYAGARRSDRSGGGSTMISADLYGDGDESETLEEESIYPSDDRSSRATAGSDSHRARSVDSSSVEGHGAGSMRRGDADQRRLSSVWERSEDETSSIGGAPARSLGDFDEDIFASASRHHYPSPSVGAAALRQSQRDVAGGGGGLPTSLVAGLGAATPSVYGDDQGSWRQSPRVESVRRKATAALHSGEPSIQEESERDAF
ncbi:unnamed protein product [Parajaminaea phylloscopi]